MAARDQSGALFNAIARRDILRDALRESRGKLARASTRGGAKTKARNARDAAQAAYDKANRTVERLAAQVPETPTPPKKKTGGGGGPPGASAQEWEIGVSYEGTRRNGNAVMLNFRIMKRGGEAVTAREAREAVRVLHGGGTVRDVARLGLHIEAVQWQRPRWDAAREGRPSDVENFSAIMQTTFLADFRVSPVDADE